MILGDGKAADGAAHARAGANETLDGLFRRAGVRHADLIALADPPDRHAIDGVEARWFTFAEADRVVSAIAAQLRRFDLPADTVVAYQLPNTVETVLTFLGILRAGMIAAPLPLLWRKADIVAALAPVGAKVLITANRAGAYPAAETAMQAAADLFPVRFVCGFGDGLPDGIVPLDALLAAAEAEAVPAPTRESDAGRHVAAITWEITARGPVPVARSHAELIAAAPPLAAGDATLSLLSATPPTSFAGIALTLLPWLARGGTLHLHHGFEPETFVLQAGERHCDTVVVPGPLLAPLSDAAFFSLPDIRQVVALWRAPEMLGSAAPWHETPALIDAACFGELGLACAARPRGEAPAPLRSSPALRLSRTDDGMLALSGAMVPAHDLGAPADDLPRLDRRFGGIVATGYRCRFEPRDGSVTVTVTAPPPDLVGIGGYRLARSEIETTVGLFGADATVAVLPNGLTGQRLAGAADDPDTVRALLAEQGTHALLAAAFGPPNGAAAA
jgi:hypothetical protein